MEEAVEFELDPTERDVILKHAQISPALKARLRFGVHGATGLIYRLSVEMFDEFMQSLSELLDQPVKRSVEETIDAVYERLTPLDEEIFGAEDVDEPQLDTAAKEILDSMPPHLRDAVVGVLNDPRFESVEQVNAALEAVIQSHNMRPVLELGGLSPHQLRALIGSDWDDPTSAFSVCNDVTLEDVAGADMFHNARTMLKALGTDGVKATSGGNLNPKFVGNLVFGDFRLRHGGRIATNVKRTYEEDFSQVMNLRYLLTFAGLIRKYRGYFKRTKLAETFLEDDKAGELYGLLFRTLFLKFDLGSPFLDPEFGVLQVGLPFAVYVLNGAAVHWRDARQLAPLLILPQIIPNMDDMPSWCTPQVLAEHYVLWPLEEMGLLERRDEEVRITPLFRKVVRLKV